MPGEKKKCKCMHTQGRTERRYVRITSIVDQEHNAVMKISWSPIKQAAAGSTR